MEEPNNQICTVATKRGLFISWEVWLVVGWLFRLGYTLHLYGYDRILKIHNIHKSGCAAYIIYQQKGICFNY